MIKVLDKSLLDSILDRPDAPRIIAQASDVLSKERKKRQKFYREVTENDKTEFIQGQIVIHSPVKKVHNDVTGLLYRLLSLYVSQHKLGYVGYEKIMISLSRNDYEPDLCFFNKEKAESFTQGQVLFPAPDFVVEVLSKSTESNDRGIKLEDYQAHEVAEYWIIDPDKKMLEQYRPDAKGIYQLILKASQGNVDCQPVAGFAIEIEAIFDEEKNLDALKQMLNNT